MPSLSTSVTTKDCQFMETTRITLNTSVPLKVMKQIAQDVQHNQPCKIYNDLILENSITEAPRNLKQVRNAKHKNARQKRNNTNVNNFADHVQNLANMALTKNTFVRQVTFGDGKVPTTILYMAKN